MMTDWILLSMSVELAVIIYLLASGSLRGPQGISGGIGPRGEPGPQGERGETGHVHVTAPEPPTPQQRAMGERFEMLKDDLSTGHFVTQGSADYEAAINTSGLKLRAPNGDVIEGVQ